MVQMAFTNTFREMRSLTGSAQTFINNKLLVFLCENGLREEAERHKDKLTNTTYIKRLVAYMKEN